MPTAFKVMRGITIALSIVIYAMLAHHANTVGQPTLSGALLALAPLFLVALACSATISPKSLGFSAVLVVMIASWWALPFIMQHTSVIFWLQDIGLMLMLLITFARTLLAGKKPLCVDFAEIIHDGELPDSHRRYAHRVTIAWAAFFACMIVLSTVLFFYYPLATWSFFVNFLTLPLVAMMFIAEFILRRYMLGPQPAGHVLDGVRAYIDSRNAH